MNNQRKIGFIGAGKVGFTLGKYFNIHGYQVCGYYSKSLQSAKEAALFTGTNYYKTLEQLFKQCDTLFITTPDKEIYPTFLELQKLSIFSHCEKMICHCSGAMSSAIFSEGDEHIIRYSIHPLFAISNKQTSYKEISNAYFTLEGTEHNIKQVKQWLKKLGNPILMIKEEQKTLYHCAAVIASNHINALINEAENLFTDCGLTKQEAHKALSQLFFHHVKAIRKQGVVSSLTGPIERNDRETVQKHLSKLSNRQALLYCLHSLELIELAKKKKKEEDYHLLEQLLWEGIQQYGKESFNHNISAGKREERKNSNVDSL